MKREHSAYSEYFVVPAKGSTGWAWQALIHRIPRTLGPSDSFSGVAKDYESARAAAQAACKKGLEKYRIPRRDLTGTVEEGK